MQSQYTLSKPLHVTGWSLPVDIYKVRFECLLKPINIYRLTPMFDEKALEDKCAEKSDKQAAADLVKKTKAIWDEAGAVPYNTCTELIGEKIPIGNFLNDDDTLGISDSEKKNENDDDYRDNLPVVTVGTKVTFARKNSGDSKEQESKRQKRQIPKHRFPGAVGVIVSEIDKDGCVEVSWDGSGKSEVVRGKATKYKLSRDLNYVPQPVPAYHMCPNDTKDDDNTSEDAMDFRRLLKNAYKTMMIRKKSEETLGTQAAIDAISRNIKFNQCLQSVEWEEKHDADNDEQSARRVPSVRLENDEQNAAGWSAFKPSRHHSRRQSIQSHIETTHEHHGFSPVRIDTRTEGMDRGNEQDEPSVQRRVDSDAAADSEQSNGLKANRVTLKKIKFQPTIKHVCYALISLAPCAVRFVAPLGCN